MNGLIFICLLFFCAVSGFKVVSEASGSASEVVHTDNDTLAIKKEFDEIRRNRRSNYPTSTINNISTGVVTYVKTYLEPPMTHGNVENTVRGYITLRTEEGKFVFGTLDGKLNKSFKSLMSDCRHRRTGDIISCRIPNSGMAEHYMMVLNKKIVEVGVVGGNHTHNGVIVIDSYKKSSYINSTECLYHKNRFISRAEQIDEQNGDDKETDRMNKQILDRLNCTLSGRNSGQLYYDLMSCTCQDFVLYWAYGYSQNNCISGFNNGCSTYLTYFLAEIAAYVDETGQMAKKAREYSASQLNLGRISVG